MCIKVENIIDIRGLNKSFGDIRAVKDLSFGVKEGELFAFLGVNGAGKSTTINILCGILKKDGGKVIIDGDDIDRNPSEIKRKLGVVFQDSVLDGALSVYDNLACRAALYGISKRDFQERLEKLADLLELGDLLKRTVSKLSGGQRRRIDVARALLHKPKILILDEPTTGLDPQTRKNLWKVIEDLREKDGVTVFLTTHYMEEAGDADSVVILDSGTIVAMGTPLALKNRYTGDYIALYGADENAVKTLGVKYETMRGTYRLFVPDTSFVTRLIVEHPEVFRDYEVIKGGMDDVFLAATGKKLVEGGEK